MPSKNGEANFSLDDRDTAIMKRQTDFYSFRRGKVTKIMILPGLKKLRNGFRHCT